MNQLTYDILSGKNPVLPSYEVEIGVIEGKSKKRQNVKLGITNAQLMFIHENGSPLKNIPARPVLQMTIDWANSELVPKTINKCIDIFLTDPMTIAQKKVEAELNRMCMRIQSHARNIIYSNDGRLAPNSPAVAARKKGNHPLFDTGQLARSIVCRLRQGERIV